MSNQVHLVKEPAMVRQGDVLVTPVREPVADEDVGALDRESSEARIVLAHGEATGHAHAFYPAQDVAERVTQKVEKPVQLFDLRNAERYSGSTLPEQKLLRLRARALLRHEEHSSISLPPGDYVAVRQHEYDDSEELRRVSD